MSSVSFLLFHNLDFEAACFRGFSSKACGLSFACPLLRPHAFQVFPGKHAGCHLHAPSFFEFLSFYVISLFLRPHPFQVCPQKDAGRRWSCIEIDGRWLYLRSPSIHMRYPYIIGRDSWVKGYIFVLARPYSSHEVGEESLSVIIITIMISLNV